MNDTAVLKTTPAKVLNDYTEFQAQTAEKYDWVMGLVAMIPCIQVRPLLWSIAGNMFTPNVVVLRDCKTFVR